MKAKKNKEMPLKTRRGVVLVALLASLILVVSIVTASYSWFSPKVIGGIGAEYVKENEHLRSERCTFSTQLCEKVTTYSSGHYIDQLDPVRAVNATEPLGAGETLYFRTSIVNPDENFASDVSLYFTSFPNATQSSCNLTVAVIFPSNTVRNVTTKQPDYALIRNAYVKVHDANDVDGPGLLQVDWFVTNNGNSSVTLNLSNSSSNPYMYLMYN